MSAPTATLRHELAEHPFLRGLDPEFLELIGGLTTHRSFRTGEEVIREGEPARELLLLTHGKVALELIAPDRPRISLLTVGPGEIVGWSWLVPPHVWQVDGRAVKPTRALAVEGVGLVRLLEDRSSDAYQLMMRLLPVITHRLLVARTQVMDLYAP
jgi:CRP-like cAMP-binding protein